MNNLHEKIKTVVDKYVDPETAHHVKGKIAEVFKEKELEEQLRAYFSGGGSFEDLPRKTQRRIQ